MCAEYFSQTMWGNVHADAGTYVSGSVYLYKNGSQIGHSGASGQVHPPNEFDYDVLACGKTNFQAKWHSASGTDYWSPTIFTSSMNNC